MAETANIVSFSGGKDSTAMLLMMIEDGIRIDEIVMFDTGWEFPEMYDHIKKVENHIGRKITILQPDKPFEYWMFDHIKTKGKNKGSKGYSWPDFRNRWCTALKRETIKRYLKTKGECKQFIGIAFDEKNRPQDKDKSYYLFENEITEAQALKYCYDLGFDWGGLYKIYDRVSCAYCPLSNLKELKNTYIHQPKVWANMAAMDVNTYRRFRNDYSIKELEVKFDREKLPSLFD